MHKTGFFFATKLLGKNNLISLTFAFKRTEYLLVKFITLMNYVCFN